MNSRTLSSIHRCISVRVGTLVLLLPAWIAAQEPPEVRSIGFREAVRLSLEQSADVQIARLQVEKSGSDLALVRTERSLQIHAGSGLGATSGIPQSIQGAAPSVAQVTVRQPLLDIGRPLRAEGAREMVRSGDLEFQAASEETAYRTGVLYLDFELSTREVERLRLELQSFEDIEELTSSRVGEGIEVPLALSRARLDTARARERLASSESRSALLEADLRSKLGLGQEVRLRPQPGGDDPGASIADIATRTGSRPLDEHPEVAAIGARIRSAQHRAAAARSERLPKLDVVGQYSMLARFNNYDDFFRRFQRHNWQAGVAFEIPVFTGRGTAERVARAKLEQRELALQQGARRVAVELQGLRAEADLRQAERLADLAKHELDFARESLDVLLAEFDEGRISLDELERGRVLESAAWGGLVFSRYALAKARLGLVYAAGAIREAFAD